MEKYHGETLDYWKTNAEDDYVKTPISVLKYITVLEEALQQVKSVDLANVVGQRELLLDFANYSESDKTSQTTDECVDNYLDSIK